MKAELIERSLRDAKRVAEGNQAKADKFRETARLAKERVRSAKAQVELAKADAKSAKKELKKAKRLLAKACAAAEASWMAKEQLEKRRGKVQKKALSVAGVIHAERLHDLAFECANTEA